MRQRLCAGVLVALFLVTSLGGVAQQEARTFEDRLVALAHQVRMGLTLATVAAHAPTIGDLRLHAQQLVNLLEGVDGRHFARASASAEIPIGIQVELASIRAGFEDASMPDDSRRLVLTSARNVASFLELALSAALDGLDARQVDSASSDMLRAYAFLLAACENPCDTTYVPALWTILRAFNLAERMESSDGS